MPDQIRSPNIEFIVGVIAVTGGGVVLLGWVFDIQWLKSIANGLASMKVNTAIGFTALGIALLLRHTERYAAVWLVRVSILLVTAIGLITLAEYVLHKNVGIDQFFLADNQTPLTRFPGRPSQMTAFNFLVLGVACLLSDCRLRQKWAEFFAAVALLVGFVAVVGYILDVEALYGAAFYSSMALHTAIFFTLVSFAVWWGLPKNLLQTLLAADNSAGIMARRMLPLAVLAPILLGLLWLQGARAGLYEQKFGWALLVVTNVFFLVGLITLVARPMLKLESERARMTELLREKNSELEHHTTELSVANSRLLTMSNTDPLTGLGNRRAFDTRLKEEFDKIRRHAVPLSLMLVDFDELKAYNDEFGHAAGDSAIKSLAMALKEHARASDFVVRIGGDEFAVILAATDLAGATVQAERFRRGIEASPWPLRPVTVSIGVAQLALDAINFEHLYYEADEALYRAKKHGRNQVFT